MSKYSFKLYLDDGSSIKITPSGITDTDLFDMDRFVLNQQSYFELCKTLAKELKIELSKIKEIKILRNKKEVEFSLITNNEYLQPVLNDLHKKKIQGHGPYQIEATVVSSTNESYLEMKKYVFENLRKNYQYFLEEIYYYDNEFSKLLHQYGVIYSQGAYKEDEQRILIELETKINIELSIYKNFRGMCRSRKKYEQNKMYNTSSRSASNIKVTQYMNPNPNYTLNREFTSLKQETDNFNQEYEEYLDEQEFSDMVGEEDSYKGYK